MSVQIKQLTKGKPTQDMTGGAMGDCFNLIPAANVVFDLYTAPSSGSTTRSAIVKV